uniref:H15 domain-containing protein n=1 Tax=Labrus bergylta TaxID=56723 RepID=A0A3Q3G4J0_9LABR
FYDILKPKQTNKQTKLKRKKKEEKNILFTGPTLPKLILSTVAESKEHKGVSLSAVKKALAAKGVDVSKANKRINTAVIKLVTKGTLSQTKGSGASGSFKLAKKEGSQGPSVPCCTQARLPPCSAIPPLAGAARGHTTQDYLCLSTITSCTYCRNTTHARFKLL